MSDEKRKYRIPFSVARCFDCGSPYNIEKGGALAELVGFYLDLKAQISLCCRIFEIRHFYLNQDVEWQDKCRLLTVPHVFYKHIKICGLGSDMLKATQNIGWKYACDMLILCAKVIFQGLCKKIFIVFIVFWKLRNSYFQGPPFSGCFRKQLHLFFYKQSKI